MLLWRLSLEQHAKTFDGGYGLLFDGRWNTVGHAVTYCATSPALCVLEKLVHVEDQQLLPPLVMITYAVSDEVAVEAVALDQMPTDWRQDEGWTQRRGDAWHEGRSSVLLRVPSAIVPVPDSPDRNVIVNNVHPDADAVTTRSIVTFTLDPRLF